MRCIIVLLAVCTVALGYGYWDLFGEGGRVSGLSPVSAALAGATIPVGGSALSIFTNPSALAGAHGSSVSLSGWGTGWREEIYYHYTCVEPYRFNVGSMSPRGSAAIALPLGGGITAGAGVANVAQYEMKATAQVYYEVAENHRELWKTLVADGTGDLNEALLSIAGYTGPVRLGLSAGYRFGSGQSVIYSNRVNYGSQFDSTYYDSWESASFAVRAGASTDLGITRLYSTFASGDDRYQSYIGVGAAASFPFLKDGFLGTEAGLMDGSHLRVSAYTRLPWIFPGANGYMGISGYRPEGAMKMGIGLSGGVDYTFGNNRVSGVYQWSSRYREGNIVPVDYINWLYDSGEAFMVGYERMF